MTLINLFDTKFRCLSSQPTRRRALYIILFLVNLFSFIRIMFRPVTKISVLPFCRPRSPLLATIVFPFTLQFGYEGGQLIRHQMLVFYLPSDAAPQWKVYPMILKQFSSVYHSDILVDEDAQNYVKNSLFLSRTFFISYYFHQRHSTFRILKRNLIVF